MKEKMGFKTGYHQGDMSPHVEDYQKPDSDYTDHGFSRTTSYIERRDAFEKKEANEVKKQEYKGRYS